MMNAQRVNISAFKYLSPLLIYVGSILSFLVLIFSIFGYPVILYYLAAAFMGILLLETVNYIEHYGLSRNMLTSGKYERAMPEHSWNSDHVLGRIMLFELSRHSDHHYSQAGSTRYFDITIQHHKCQQVTRA